MADAVDVKHEAGAQRFVAVIDGHEAMLRYRLAGKRIDLYSTFVPEALRGRGIAEQLAHAAFEYAKANSLSVTPSCSYISGAYLKRHPEYLPLTQP